MAWIRQLDENKAGQRLWAATIYTPNGKRLTQTHVNKKVIEDWAKKQEAEISEGGWIDPRLGRKTVSEIWDLYGDGRRLETASRKRDASHWKNWVGPRWGDEPIGRILKPDVSGWIVEWERTGIGGWTVIASLGLLRSLLEIAVDARLIKFNAARGVTTAPPPKHIDRVLTDDECDRLIANFYTRFPGTAAGLFVEMMAYTGPRYEELAALANTPHQIDRRQHLVMYRPVLEKDGNIRPYPKSDAGDRWVPVDDDLWPRFSAYVDDHVPPGALVFRAPGGGVQQYDNWLKRVWKRGLLGRRPMSELEIEEWKAKRVAEGKRPWKATWFVEDEIVVAPQPTPHDLRHLYGTRLSEQGLPAHERRYLMGHTDDRAGRRYENFRAERFTAARAAMANFRRRST